MACFKTNWTNFAPIGAISPRKRNKYVEFASEWKNMCPLKTEKNETRPINHAIFWNENINENT